jgi:hypothetical protein
MIRNLFIFFGTFVAGAIIALVARAAMFNPEARHAGHASDGPEYTAMVSNPLVPAKATLQPAGSSSAGHEHASPSRPPDESEPGGPAAEVKAAGAKPETADASLQPVNTICAICGMPVDPNLPTLEYQGKRIGFGCKLCPPKFKADPDRYGPFYLRDERMKK